MLKNKSFFIILVLALSLAISSCTITKETAPIQYNHKKNTSSYSSATKPLVEDLGESVSATPIAHQENDIIVPHQEEINLDEEFIAPEPQRHLTDNKKVIYHEVQNGETVEDIAAKYHQPVSEIVKLNDLQAPYYLDEFQILKIKITTPKLTDAIIDDPDNINANNKILTSNEHRGVKKHDIAPVHSDIADSGDIVTDRQHVEYVTPVNGKIIKKFGGVNKGVNIAAKLGTKVLATASGKVIYADYDATFGNLVIIKIDNKNIIVSYAHLQGLILAKGAYVKQGDIIGYVGSTGKVEEPQLHFGIREGKIAKDPLQFVKF